MLRAHVVERRRRGRPRCSAPRRSSRRRAPRAICTPSASSTRAVAALMFGTIAGCTQPASISILRACLRVGHASRTLPRRAPCRAAFAAAAAANMLAELHRRREQRAVRQELLQQSARAGAAPSGRATLLSTILRPMSTSRPYLHAGRARRLAIAAGEAAVQVQLRAARGCGAFQHLLDQIDAAARAVELVAQQLVGRAGGGAEAAVHALAQDGVGLVAVGRVADEFGEIGLHRCAQKSGYSRPGLKMRAGSKAAFRRDGSSCSGAAQRL